MSKVIEKARELAVALSESPELQEVREAEIAMNRDPEALEIIAEFQERQQEFQDAFFSGRELTPEQELVRAAIESKMENNSSIRRYLEAQQRLEKLLQTVNTVIGQALSGDSACSSGGCASCGSSCG